MSMLHFLDISLLERVNNVDNEIQHIEKSDYLSNSKVQRSLSLLPATNVVLVNAAGRYLVVVDVTVDTAKVKLFVDGNYTEFDNFFAAIVSGTVVSVTSDIATAADITLISLI